MSEREKNLFDLATIIMDGTDDEKAAAFSLLWDALSQTEVTVEGENDETLPALLDGFDVQSENKRIGFEITVYRLPESVG